jgi:hypothetical protein
MLGSRKRNGTNVRRGFVQNCEPVFLIIGVSLNLADEQVLEKVGFSDSSSVLFLLKLST